MKGLMGKRGLLVSASALLTLLASCAAGGVESEEGAGGSGGTTSGGGGSTGTTGGGGSTGGSGGSGSGGSGSTGGGSTGGGSTGGGAPPAPVVQQPQPIPVPGRTFYVDAATGDDAAEGLTRASALATLAEAVRRMSNAGGDKMVLIGSFAEPLQINGFNNAPGGANPALPTVVQCDFDVDGNPLPAVIDGGIAGAASFPFDQQGLPPGFGTGQGGYLDRGVRISSSNYLTISGISVRGIVGEGVFTWKTSHVRVEFVDVEWCSNSGIKISNGDPTGTHAQDATVAYCRVNQCNLGRFTNRATLAGFNSATETVTIERIDGFEVFGCELTNSLMQGIDFKFGARNGLIHHNLVENTRATGIYCNEGDDTDIYRNVVRRVGWYDPQDGTGLQLSATWMQQNVPGFYGALEAGAVGIAIRNGDLGGPAQESGRSSGIRVFENEVSWTRKSGISVYNEWRAEGLPGWELDDLHIFNNVVYRANHKLGVSAAGLVLDVGMTNSTVYNNIVAAAGELGIEVWQASTGSFFATNEIANNLLWNNKPGGVIGTNPVQADPLFVVVPGAPGDPADFQVDAASPARGAGIGVAPIAGGIATPDIGAYQYGVSRWLVGSVYSP